VQDSRKVKKLFIPDQVIDNFELNFKNIQSQACKTNEYEGVNYLILPKLN